MGAAENAALGVGLCPCCNSPKAVFKLSTKGLAYVTCNACNFQGFARSGNSDERLRQRIGRTGDDAELIMQAASHAPAPVPPKNPPPGTVWPPEPKPYKNPFMLG